MARAFSIHGTIFTWPRSIPAAASRELINLSASRMSWGVSALPMLTPSKSGPTTAASSSRISPVSRALTRTMTRWPMARSLGTHSAARSLALAFSSGGTESSRSTIITSAAKPVARSNMLARLPGTNTKLRRSSNFSPSPSL